MFMPIESAGSSCALAMSRAAGVSLSRSVIAVLAPASFDCGP